MIEYVFALSGLLVIIALFRGPTFADRALAAGAFVNIAIIILLIFSLRTETTMYLDIAVAMVFMSFVGTLAIAKYVRRSHA